MTTHTVKTHPQFFGKWIHRNKSFEIRRDDRKPPCAPGDTIEQREYIPDPKQIPGGPDTGKYTGRIGVGTIVYVLRGFAGLAQGYCALEAPFEKMRIAHGKTDEQIAAELNGMEFGGGH